MKVGENYRIESDALNVTLYKRGIAKETQKEYWTTIGYYAFVKNALKDLANIGLRETELKDLRTITQRQEEIYALIEAACKEE